MELKTALRIVDRIGEYERPTKEQRTEAWQYLHDSRWAYSLGGWYATTAEEMLRLKQIKDNGVKRF